MKGPAPILIVEDDDAVRTSLEILLEHRGLDVVTARDGIDALRTLDALGGAAVVLLDWMMPRMNGREFMSEMRKRPNLAGIPVLVVTAFSHLSDVPEPFLSEPVTAEQLATAVASYVAA